MNGKLKEMSSKIKLSTDSKFYSDPKRKKREHGKGISLEPKITILPKHHGVMDKSSDLFHYYYDAPGPGFESRFGLLIRFFRNNSEIIRRDGENFNICV